MKPENNFEKNALTALAWQELILAIKPKSSSGSISCPKKQVANERAAVTHPALITTAELGNWEFFG